MTSSRSWTRAELDALPREDLVQLVLELQAKLSSSTSSTSLTSASSASSIPERGRSASSPTWAASSPSKKPSPASPDLPPINASPPQRAGHAATKPIYHYAESRSKSPSWASKPPSRASGSPASPHRRLRRGGGGGAGAAGGGGRGKSPSMAGLSSSPDSPRSLTSSPPLRRGFSEPVLTRPTASSLAKQKKKVRPGRVKAARSPTRTRSRRSTRSKKSKSPSKRKGRKSKSPNKSRKGKTKKQKAVVARVDGVSDDDGEEDDDEDGEDTPSPSKRPSRRRSLNRRLSMLELDQAIGQTQRLLNAAVPMMNVIPPPLSPMSPMSSNAPSPVPYDEDGHDDDDDDEGDVSHADPTQQDLIFGAAVSPALSEHDTDADDDEIHLSARDGEAEARPHADSGEGSALTPAAGEDDMTDPDSMSLTSTTETADTEGRLTIPPGSGNATFKLRAYGLGLSDAELRAMADKKTNTQCYICLDYNKCNLSLFGKKKRGAISSAIKKKADIFSSLKFSHVRSFQSIKQVVLDTSENVHFSIYFNDSKPVAQCLAMNKDEGQQICGLLNQISREHLFSVLVSGAPDLQHPGALYEGPVHKRGKVSWGWRWMVISVGKLEIFRTKDAVVAINNIDLTDERVEVEAMARKTRQMLVRCPERNYTFKLYSRAERDTVVSLLDRARKLARRDRLRSESAPSDNALPAAARSSPRSVSPVPPSGNSNASALSPFAASYTPVMSRRENRAELVQGFLDTLARDMPFTKAHQHVSFSEIVDQFGEENRKKKQKIHFEEDVALQEAMHPAHPRLLLMQQQHQLRFGVFRLMSMLRQSMEHGAMLSDKLYVPATVWYQYGAKIVAYDAKIEAFEILQQVMLHIQADVFDDISALISVLTDFRITAEIVQNKLAQHLTYVHSIKTSVSDTITTTQSRGKSRKGRDAGADGDGDTSPSMPKRSIWGTLKKRLQRGVAEATVHKVDDTTRYVKMLTSILGLVDIFQTWMHRVDNEPNLEKRWGTQHTQTVSLHLLEICTFFHDVVCNVIIRDLKTVVERYMKHCTRSVAVRV